MNKMHRTQKIIHHAKKQQNKSSSIIDYANQSELQNQNKIMIPFGQKSFKEALKLAKGNEKLITELKSSTETVSNLLSGEGNGTKIPYLATILGNFLVNPLSVNISTLYRMMQTHEVLRPAHETNVTFLSQMIKEYYHEDKEITKEIRKSIKLIKGGLSGLITQIASSLNIGFWVGALDWYKDREGNTQIKQLSQRPPITIAYTANPQGDIDNIWQYVYSFPQSQMQNLLSGGFIGNPLFNPMWGGELNEGSSLGNLTYPFRTNIIQTFGLLQLDKRYTAYYVFDRINGKISPFGNPFNIAAYNVWLQYETKRQLQMGAFTRAINPLLIAYSDAHATIQLGNQSIKAIEAMYLAAENVTSDSVMILAGRKGEIYEVEAIQTQADFDAFNNSLEYDSKMLERTQLNPEGLYSSDSSYATVLAQNSIYNKNFSSILQDILNECILPQIIGFLIRENFDKNITDYGWFELGSSSLDDLLKQEKLLEGASQLGIKNPMIFEDCNYMLRQLGMPEIDEKHHKKLLEANILYPPVSSKNNMNKIDSQSNKGIYEHRSVTEGL